MQGKSYNSKPWRLAAALLRPPAVWSGSGHQPTTPSTNNQTPSCALTWPPRRPAGEKPRRSPPPLARARSLSWRGPALTMKYRKAKRKAVSLAQLIYRKERARGASELRRSATFPAAARALLI